MSAPAPDLSRQWRALWALVLGFFMILVDSTIVTVATPVLMRELGADVSGAVWVTSSYLLAYAVPLLITGRLGDRFGPKRIYLIGLATFTVASLWCGLTGSVGELIAARGLQGLGASMMAPQTMSVITRTFPAERRGRAMSLWGAVAGVATLVGPILGGVLVDTLGWEWIFFVNVPVGVVGLVLAWRLVPTLPVHAHRFDMPGVVLWAVGMILAVFGIQEGQTFAWGTIAGPLSVWMVIAAGVAVLCGFVWWQARNRDEPLMALALFRNHNFRLANIAIGMLGLTITAYGFPVMLYAQSVLGLPTTAAALLMAPTAILGGVLAPLAGRIADRSHPRHVAAFGMACMLISVLWLAAIMKPGTPYWALLLPMVPGGVANAFMWPAIGSTFSRTLPDALAGSGSGVYNTMRQVGAVLGSAGIAAAMQARLATLAPGASLATEGGAAALPPELHAGYSAALGQSLLLPAVAIAIGLVAVLGFHRPQPRAQRPVPAVAGD